jgi:G2/mitotic-specific cyclin-B, other
MIFEHASDLCCVGSSECTKLLVSAHSSAADSKLRSVYKKYSSEQFGGVALRPPAAAVEIK